MATDNDYQVKGVFNKFKQAVHYYNVMESKVLQATNTEAWGAPSTLMRSLADGTRETDKMNVIMPALYRRLTVKDTRQWLQVYKAVVLLEYLIKYGDDQVFTYAQSHQDVLVTLQSFEFIDEKGQDKGYNVRIRSKTVQGLLKDPEEIKRIRENGRLSQDRFIGVGSDDISTSTTMETKDDTKAEETNQSPAITKKLPSIDHPLPPPSAIMKVEPSQEETAKQPMDEMDNVIFREDFIDPLDEDNHAMVFPAAGGKGKAATLSVDDFSDDEDSEDGSTTKKSKKSKKSKKNKKKETVEPPANTVPEPKVQEPKKKSRFSLAGVFSRSKQAVATDEPPADQQTAPPAPNLQDTATVPTAIPATTNVDPVTRKEEDDVWGDFACPDQGSEFVDEDTKQKEEDLLDLDCDIMTTSSARTSVDNNDMLLLDMDMPIFNHINVNTHYSSYTALSPPPLVSKSNSYYTQPSSNTYPTHTTLSSPPLVSNNSYYTQPSSNIPMVANNYGYPPSSRPPMMTTHSSNVPTPTVQTPTTPFDFDPLGYTGLSTPAPQQLTQHWYPWMATNNNTPPLQQKQQQQQQQQQQPLTVDDLLS